MLAECLHLLQMTAPKENGVILEAHGTPKLLSNAKRKRKVGKKQTKLDFKNLPVAKKQNPYAGRRLVGVQSVNSAKTSGSHFLI